MSPLRGVGARALFGAAALSLVACATGLRALDRYSLRPDCRGTTGEPMTPVLSPVRALACRWNGVAVPVFATPDGALRFRPPLEPGAARIDPREPRRVTVPLSAPAVDLALACNPQEVYSAEQLRAARPLAVHGVGVSMRLPVPTQTCSLEAPAEADGALSVTLPSREVARELVAATQGRFGLTLHVDAPAASTYLAVAGGCAARCRGGCCDARGECVLPAAQRDATCADAGEGAACVACVEGTTCVNARCRGADLRAWTFTMRVVEVSTRHPCDAVSRCDLTVEAAAPDGTRRACDAPDDANTGACVLRLARDVDAEAARRPVSLWVHDREVFRPEAVASCALEVPLSVLVRAAHGSGREARWVTPCGRASLVLMVGAQPR
jgi:hypothetical protein